MRAIARLFSICAFAAVLAVAGSALLAAGAVAQPTGTPPAISPAADSTTTSPQIGDTLTEVPATWSGTPTTITIQWLECDYSGNNCFAIPGATGPTYTVSVFNFFFFFFSTIEVSETDIDNTGTATLTSGPTLVVGLPPVNTTPPTIAGFAGLGQTLTETNGTWTNNPTSFRHHWLDCDVSGNNCRQIPNATGAAYTITATTYVGDTIRVQESASNPGGAGASVRSAPSAVITALTPPVDQSPPTITGVTQQGQTLTEISGTWNPGATSFSHQWLDCDSSGNNCTTIPGATGPTYAPTEGLLGDTVEVQETAANPAGSSAPANSAPTAVITLNPSTTTLLTVPAAPVTNQTVTLIATVTSSFSLAPPAGSVSFEDAGAPIGGCVAAPVSTSNQSVQVTCQAVVSAATSPNVLTAIFTPNSGAGIAGSTSQPLSLPVGPASTSTTLDVSNPTVFAGSTATYTATVASGQSGPVQPSGSVQFSDQGKPVASCSGQALVQSQGSLSAQCKIRYRTSGRHTIAAHYSGDANFSGSASSSQAVKIQQRPTRIAGALTAKTYWTDYFTPTYTRFLAMGVHKLGPGTTIVLICRGQGCPFASQSLLVAGKACRPKTRCVVEKAQVVNLVSRLRGKKLGVGTVLTVELTRPGWIGKAYVITIRSGRKPNDRIQCLAPGSTRPGVGC
jgi:hypothetical protein